VLLLSYILEQNEDEGDRHLMTHARAIAHACKIMLPRTQAEKRHTMMPPREHDDDDEMSMATRETATMLMMHALLTTKRAVATKTIMMPLSSIAPWGAGAPDFEVNSLTL
jgi:hypothetical protein